jgi:hypothetical protein
MASTAVINTARSLFVRRMKLLNAKIQKNVTTATECVQQGVMGICTAVCVGGWM